MEALKHHFVHHRKHMLGCVFGALVAVIGGLAHQPIVAIAGTVICAAFCLAMLRTMVVRPKGG
jgi:hypothetical protein